jgi:hypothetical protein
MSFKAGSLGDTIKTGINNETVKTKTVTITKVLNSLIATNTSMYPKTPTIPVKDVNEIKIAKKTRKRFVFSVCLESRVHLLYRSAVSNKRPDQAKTSCCTVTPKMGISGKMHINLKVIVEILSDFTNECIKK